MSDQTLRWSRDIARSESTSTDFYRAVWRWHFYAGLLVLPFLIILSVTGGRRPTSGTGRWAAC